MIEHYSTQKFALDDVLIDYIGNELKDYIQRNDEEFFGDGLIDAIQSDQERYQDKYFGFFILKQEMSFACF